MPGWKKDLNRKVKKSTKKLIIEKYGKKNGEILVNCLEGCMVGDKTKDQVANCFIECVRRNGIDANTIPDDELKQIMDLLDHLDHYTKIG